MIVPSTTLADPLEALIAAPRRAAPCGAQATSTFMTPSSAAGRRGASGLVDRSDRIGAGVIARHSPPCVPILTVPM